MSHNNTFKYIGEFIENIKFNITINTKESTQHEHKINMNIIYYALHVILNICY